MGKRSRSKDHKCIIFKSSLNKLIKVANKLSKKVNKLSTKRHKKHKTRKSFTKSRKGKKSHKRFGRMPGLFNIMSNYPADKMSLFQEYTGMPPNQMGNHLKNVDPNLQDYFYGAGPAVPE